MAERTPAQVRASAQRKLAKELKAGTFKPSAVGARAREAAKKLQNERKELLTQIRQYKVEVYGGSAKFNRKRSDKNVEINPRTGKRRTIEELRVIADVIDQIQTDQQRDEFYWRWDNLFEDTDYESAFYYK